jgi:hypothetical protein
LGEHVPDRFGGQPSDIDLRHLCAAVLAEAALGGLVALRVRGMPERACMVASSIAQRR